MNQIKQASAIALAALMSLSVFCACGSTSEETTEAATTIEETTSTEEKETETETEEITTEETTVETETEEAVSVNLYQYKDYFLNQGWETVNEGTSNQKICLYDYEARDENNKNWDAYLVSGLYVDGSWDYDSLSVGYSINSELFAEFNYRFHEDYSWDDMYLKLSYGGISIEGTYRYGDPEGAGFLEVSFEYNVKTGEIIFGDVSEDQIALFTQEVKDKCLSEAQSFYTLYLDYAEKVTETE